MRLHGQGAFSPGTGFDHRTAIGHGIGWLRQFISSENGAYARHGQGRAYVEMFDLGMGQGAGEQLADEHALGPEVVGKTSRSGQFGPLVRRGVITPSELWGERCVVLWHGLPLSHIFGPAHQGGEDLVVILATAKVSRNTVGQLLPGGVRLGFEIAEGGHEEARCTVPALEALFVEDTLLQRMQPAVGTGQPLDGQNTFSANAMGEDGAGIPGHVVDEYGAGTAFASVATCFEAGESELAAQGLGQGLLGHDIHPALLPVNLQGNESLDGAGGSLGTGSGRSGKQEAGRGNGTGCDDAFDKLAPGHPSGPDIFDNRGIHCDSVYSKENSGWLSGRTPYGVAGKLKHTSDIVVLGRRKTAAS